jgi:hypothetical protein
LCISCSGWLVFENSPINLSFLMGSSGFIKPLLQNAWIEPLPSLTTPLKLLISTP